MSQSSRTHIHYKLRLLFLLIGIIIGLSACQKNETQSLLDKLDYMISNKKEYDSKKEEKIIKLKHMLNLTDLSNKQEHELDSALCREYKKYQVDSAIHYAELDVAATKKLNNKRAFYYAYLQLAQLYTYTGMSVEALQILRSIQSSSLPRDLVPLYYDIFHKYYDYYAYITNHKCYFDIGAKYSDSLLALKDTASFLYKISLSGKYVNTNKVKTIIPLLKRMLVEFGKDSPLYAETAYMTGVAYSRIHNRELEKKYYILSAIADIKNCTKENLSFQSLAEMFYESGELSRASRYTQAANEDAIFCSTRFRMLQMSKFYSIINSSHKIKEEKSKGKLQVYLILISILSTILALLFIYTYKQFRKLSRTKEKLSASIQQLALLNDKLNNINEQLSEANAVKEQYIGQFFDICSLYIDKIDEYRKSMKRLVQDRAYDELYDKLKSTSMTENELDDLYHKFDAIFLKLYPTFVTDFNSLLEPGKQITLKPRELLNKELRIYALLRLGIADCYKVASFLRCSLSTVYNYKTKIRNNAAVPKDDFEKMIMNIGTKHVSAK